MPRVFYDPRAAQYHAPGHPEAPFRVSESAKTLKAAGIPLLVPEAIIEDSILRLAHSQEHLDALADGGFVDPDTPHFPNIDSIARISAAGALSAAQSALQGAPSFSLMRPPGHHAGRNRIAGFCYLNNLAIAVLTLLAQKEIERAAILDIDVHHGDGTEDIVSGLDSVRFVSLHQSPLYPGTGLKSRGSATNIPLEAGAGPREYFHALEPQLQRLADFKPQILAVSAGFDTYKHCPLANLALDKEAYQKIGALIAQTGLPRFAVLEGGYHQDLPDLIAAFIGTFSD